MTLSKYGTKQRVRALREQYATVGGVSFEEISMYYASYLARLPVHEQPKDAAERRAVELTWLERQIEHTRRQSDLRRA
jgi:hypothetical protein